MVLSKTGKGQPKTYKEKHCFSGVIEIWKKKGEQKKTGFHNKTPVLVSIARWLDCLPGTYKTLGVRPEIPALKRQRQEDLKIKAILNLKQFKASLECPRFSFKRGLPHQDSAQTLRNFTRVWKDLKLNSC